LMAVFELPALVRERRLLAPLLLGGATVLAIPVVRNLPLILPASLVVLTPAWARAATEVARTQRRRRWQRPLAITALLAVVVVTGWLRLADRLSGAARVPLRTGWGLDERFPAGAVTFVEREALPGPLLNNFDVGGYLLY